MTNDSVYSNFCSNKLIIIIGSLKKDAFVQEICFCHNLIMTFKQLAFYQLRTYLQNCVNGFICAWSRYLEGFPTLIVFPMGMKNKDMHPTEHRFLSFLV